MKDLIDIYLITYNRAKKLDETFEKLFAESSPIRDFEITVIDNNSTDNTQNVVENWQQKFPNLKYTKNRYNIGGNANIMKAFYIAHKEYVWIIADNDDYDWTHWNELEKALKQKNDAVIISDFDNPKLHIAKTMKQATFLPSVIYRTELIDDDVMTNMAFNISNMFPHMVLFTKILNEKRKYAVLEGSMIIPKRNDDYEGGMCFVRGCKDRHPYMNEMSWYCGYANTLHFIKDKKIRDFVAINSDTPTMPSLKNYKKMVSINKQHYNDSIYNMFCIYNVLPTMDKLPFLLHCFFYRRFLNMYKTETHRCLVLFGIKFSIKRKHVRLSIGKKKEAQS